MLVNPAKRLIQAAKEALAIASGELDPATFRTHVASMSEEFRGKWISDVQYEVVDLAEAHVWLFKLTENGLGERILSPTSGQHSLDHVRATSLAGRAHRFADREALREGRIDRGTAP